MHREACDPAARRLVTRGDPRVTRVGGSSGAGRSTSCRSSSTCSRGDLSLVGPRPHALAAVSSRQESFEAIVQGYAARHRVRPGLTGWAQIHGWRGEIDEPSALQRRVEHDLYYIENWSLRLDLYILAVTPLRLLDTNHAY
jgi:lipopolysaccharide/colanic/teichoic acid biosynthesis glycosyltransferase